MTYLAHRHSMRSVGRFIPAILNLLDQHKRKGFAHIVFNPLELNLSVETAVCRLRDAVYSLSQGLTSHASINVDDLKTVWPLYKVTSDGTNVVVKSRTTEQEEPVTIHTGQGTSIATLKVEDPRFVETLSAFALLLGQRYLQGQVAIVGDLSDQIRHRLESGNDIVIIQDGPNKYHML